MSDDRRPHDTAPLPALDTGDASLDIVPFDAVDGFASAECEIEVDDGLALADATDAAPELDLYADDDFEPLLARVADFADDGDIEATMDYAREAAVEPPGPAIDSTVDYVRGAALEPADPDGPAGQTADLGVRDDHPELDRAAEPPATAPRRAPRPAIAGAPDYDALDAPLDGPTGTADFGSAAPLLDALDAPAPEPEPEPDADAGPPAIATAWTERLTAAVDDLVIAHARRETWRGQFGIGERGLTHQPGPARSDAELDADLARLHALLTAAAAAVRQDATRAPAAIVVADALARLEAPTDAPALARALRRALYTRTRKRRARLDAEADAVDARRRALQSQRRLRADLAARLARLDASIAAQDAAVRRDEIRARNLDAERADLDGVFERVDVPSDPPAPAGDVRKVETSDPGDAVRRLLAVGTTL